ncbi:MAG TPA: hypothetical protein VGS19_26425 [Streptosporangiaceae bacterium]|nr:hypothetical protein [Streptosporangiaceae bacterium]
MPEQADAVLSALRLGWYMAEVRGRHRSEGPADLESGPALRGYALPLLFERTSTELRVQALAVLGSLADGLGANTSRADGSSYSQGLEKHARQLADCREHGRAEAATMWQAMSALIYRFDAHIQDVLTARSDLQAGGYQLGRALAECYWALDPGASMAGPASWTFLLGTQRCAEISRLLGRMSSFMAPAAGQAIEGSLKVWKSVASDGLWRQGAEDALYRQVRVWYELAVLGQDPVTLIRPYARLRNFYVTRRALAFFSGRLTLAAAGVAGLIALIVIVGSGAGNAVASTLLAIVAAAGLSTAGLSARRFAKELNADLATVAITVVPPRPGTNPKRNSRMIYATMKSR